jgi:serine/threonine protein kinase
LSRFVAEIKTVGILEHPNIVPIHDVGMDPDGSFFFVMKFVEGETVEDIITRLKKGDPEALRAYPIDRRLEIVRGVLHALEYAHARGVIHRDIKPANVMVGANGEVVVMDWGIARNIGTPELETPEGMPVLPPTSTTATRQGTVMGTPAYMSPEQFLGEIDKIDGRSDVYSLGVMLWELLTLKNAAASAPDLDAVKAMVLSRKSVMGEFSDLQPGVGANLAWLSHRATASDRDARFASATAMLEEMDRIADGRGRMDCPFSTLQRATGETKRFVDHHPFVAMGMALSAAGTAAAATATAGVMMVVLAIT